jgi:hypothetical protein
MHSDCHFNFQFLMRPIDLTGNVMWGTEKRQGIQLHERGCTKSGVNSEVRWRTGGNSHAVSISTVIVWCYFAWVKDGRVPGQASEI